MRIETKRLVITDFTPDMAEAVHLGSLDEDTQRFLPDEVFETVEVASDVIADLMDCYSGTEGPFVHPMLVNGVYAGYVQLVPIGDARWDTQLFNFFQKFRSKVKSGSGSGCTSKFTGVDCLVPFPILQLCFYIWRQRHFTKSVKNF